MSDDDVTVSIATVTIKTHRPQAVVRFGRDLLGYEVRPHATASVLLAGDGPSLLVQPSDEPVVTGALHLDLRPSDHDACVARARALGASPVSVGQRGTEPWTVLADPGGTVFCVLDSVTEA